MQVEQVVHQLCARVRVASGSRLHAVADVDCRWRKHLVEPVSIGRRQCLSLEESARDVGHCPVVTRLRLVGLEVHVATGVEEPKMCEVTLLTELLRRGGE